MSFSDKFVTVLTRGGSSPLRTVAMLGVAVIVACCLSFLLGLAVGRAVAAPNGSKERQTLGDSCSPACQLRVQVKAAHAKWRKVVTAYGVPKLRARMRCESGGHGGYSLSTTGNGFWFAYQFEPRAWYGAGGRMRGGLPVGVWTKQPSRLEQDYRAARWDEIHGGDPWPHCV